MMADGAHSPDALDVQIDYQGIAERSEADRLAGRTLSHTEVKRRVADMLAHRSRERRPA
jgi:hypothetical protein